MTAPAVELRPEQPRLRDRILSRSELATLPEPSPLIHRTIDLNTVALLAGYHGSLKSFIAESWAGCVATGHAWSTRPVEPGRVLYLAGEGAHGLHRRFRAWETHHGVTLPDDTLSVLPQPIRLLDGRAVAELRHIVRGEGFRFVVIDTLAKVTAGMDENSAQDMGVAVGALYAIRESTGDGTVLIVHHTGKDRTTVRGSSALEAGVDTVYTTEGDATLVKLTRTKRKDGPTEDVHQLRLHVIDGTSSGVVLPTDDVRLGSDRARELVSLFDSHFGSTGASSSTLRDASQMPKATYHRALNDLVTAGVLTNTGTKSRPFYVRGGMTDESHQSH